MCTRARKRERRAPSPRHAEACPIASTRTVVADALLERQKHWFEKAHDVAHEANVVRRQAPQARDVLAMGRVYDATAMHRRQMLEQEALVVDGALVVQVVEMPVHLLL